VKFYEILLHLMTDVLGYPKFGAQGGDVGAGITSDLGRAAGDHVIGIHLHSNLSLPYPKPSEQMLSPAEKEYYARLDKWEEDEGAYSHMQSTKPQTIAYGLNDSPVALAAYIVEKFRDWGDTGGNVESRFTKDELLTNVMIYWVTQTMNSAMRGYFESRRNPRPPWKVGRVEVPTGVALFPHDFDFPHAIPRELAERSYNIRRWVEMPRGGHFAASEEPEALARDIREFFRPLRSST
jgi:pimeloyl-ACP methyl ester carboxylesterase